MLITKEILESVNACSPALAEFSARYPEGIWAPPTRWTQRCVLEDSFLRRFWGWAVTAGLCPAWSMASSDWSRADLSGADLSGANLSWANLTWANLTGADLSGANLTRANLTWAYLTEADLTYAIGYVAPAA